MYKDMEYIASALEAKLTDIARDIIMRSHRLPPSHQARFAKDPDRYEEHHPKWHQWGIITHSRMFGEMYRTEARELLKRWGLEKRIDDYMSREIDSAPRSGLMRIVAPLHDIGKFDKVLEPGETMQFDFKGHERLSQLMILGEHVRGSLGSYGLTQPQIGYIAECAGKHFELGKIRQHAKRSPQGYTRAYAKEGQFQRDVGKLLPYFNGLAVEVGLMFLADSLSKTDVMIEAGSDEELHSKRPAAEQELRERDLPAELMAAVMQRPVQIEIAKQYLTMITER